MKIRLIRLTCLLTALLALATVARAQGSAFTYQGRLSANGAPAQGAYDFEFRVFDAETSGTQQGATLTINALGVTNGLFTATLNPGAGVFTGVDRWLEIGVVTNGGGSFSTLAPRQPITPTPYAIRATEAGYADSAGSASTFGVPLSGEVAGPQGATTVALVGGETAANVATGVGAANAATSANTPNTIVKRDGSGNFSAGDITATSFSGSGAGLTGLNAWQSSGNAGTTPGTHFLGTTDDQPLEFKVNNQRGLRLEPTWYADTVNVIGGSALNSVGAGGVGATIGGGVQNTIQPYAYYATIGGGNLNESGGNYATVPGGAGNTAGGQFSFAAGHDAKALHNGAFVWADSPAGGFSSTANDQFLIRAAGGVGINNNNPNGAALAVNGNVTIEGIISANAVSAASLNTPEITTPKIGTTWNQALELIVNNQRGLRLEPNASGAPNLIAGSPLNFVGAGVVGATIAGGGAIDYDGSVDCTNSVLSDFGGVGGGLRNTIAAGARFATIAGGAFNNIGTGSGTSAIGGGYVNTIAADSLYATIAGGGDNEIGANTWYGAIGGGRGNDIAANSFFATIAGGDNNDIGTSDNSAIGGGGDNTIAANSQYATIPGGHLNAATTYAFAAGHRAKANHQGAFVWADSADADFASTAANQFAIRATGGVQLSDSTPSLSFGTTTRQMLNLLGTRYAIGVQASSLYFRCDNAAETDGFIWYKGGSHEGGYTQPGAGGTELMHLVASGLYATSFNPTSDRNAKEDFAPVSPGEVLAKVVALPITHWRFKQDSGTRHLGPMAQDFYAAFNIGPDDKHIATVDADGVALAAIQGLNQKVEEQRAENAELKHRLEVLEQIIRHRN